jgi:hypothetical protein
VETRHIIFCIVEEIGYAILVATLAAIQRGRSTSSRARRRLATAAGLAAVHPATVLHEVDRAG